MATTLTPAPSSPAATGWRIHAGRVLRVTSAAILAGLLAGLAFGAIGGRLAMRVVTLQTDEALVGLTTDDGARTGAITLGGSVGLGLFVTFLGVIGALTYLVVRELLPRRRRGALFAAITGIVGGSMVVHGDGVDFTVLGTPWVSAAMFIGILAGYGWATSAIAERFLASGGLADRASTRRLAPLLVALAPGLVIVPVGAVMAGVVAARTSGLAARARPALVAVGRLAVVATTVVAGTTLVGTLAELSARPSGRFRFRQRWWTWLGYGVGDRRVRRERVRDRRRHAAGPSRPRGAPTAPRASVRDEAPAEGTNPQVRLRRGPASTARTGGSIRPFTSPAEPAVEACWVQWAGPPGTSTPARALSDRAVIAPRLRDRRASAGSPFRFLVLRPRALADRVVAWRRGAHPHRRAGGRGGQGTAPK